MVQFFYNSNRHTISNEDSIVKVIEEIVFDYGLVIDYINIILVSDEELLEMNKQFLNHDYFTDIITFNYSEIEDHLESELYISIDRVSDNAVSYKVETNVELNRVIIHGILHLAGFEDSDLELKEEMQKLENYYLDRLLFHVKPNDIHN